MKKTILLLALLTFGISNAQITIGAGSTALESNTGLNTPISIWYNFSMSQQIYLASELDTESVEIIGLEFELSNATTLTNSNGMLDVWIGHTERLEFNPEISSSGADWISISESVQVLTNGSFTQTGSTVTITFEQPFMYNGVDNIVITFDDNKPGNDGSGVQFYQTPASDEVMSLMIRTDNVADNPDPHNPPLNFTGGTPATSVQAKNTRPVVTFLLGEEIETPVICVQPTDLEITDITTETAIVSWTDADPTPDSGYEVYYSTSDTEPNEDTEPQYEGISGTSQELSELESNTTYYVWVRSACSDEDYSEWTLVESFTTETMSVGALDLVSFSVYPNPVTTELYFESNTRAISVDIYDLNGRKILTKEIISNNINVEMLQTGTYIVKFTTESGEVIDRKIVKQ